MIMEALAFFANIVLDALWAASYFLSSTCLMFSFVILCVVAKKRPLLLDAFSIDMLVMLTVGAFCNVDTIWRTFAMVRMFQRNAPKWIIMVLTVYMWAHFPFKHGNRPEVPWYVRSWFLIPICMVVAYYFHFEFPTGEIHARIFSMLLRSLVECAALIPQLKICAVTTEKSKEAKLFTALLIAGHGLRLVSAVPSVIKLVHKTVAIPILLPEILHAALGINFFLTWSHPCVKEWHFTSFEA